jgi:hypothetical protein
VLKRKEPIRHQIQRVSPNSRLPVSWNQEKRLLVEEWAQIHSVRLAAFNVPSTFRLTGDLDTAALEDGLNRIIQRHSILRSVFFPAPDVSLDDRATRLRRFAQTGIVEPGLFEQAVRHDAILPFHVRTIDTDALSTTTKESRLRDIVEEELEGPFDHDVPPMMRAVLVNMAPKEHLLLLVMDHLVSDLWSLRILRRELRLLYAHSLQGGTNPLPELPLQFSDFAAWQQEQLHTHYFDRAVDYWRKQWETYESAQLNYGDFPLALPKPADATMAVAVELVELDSEESQKIRTFARRASVTLHTLFITVFTVLLQRYSGKDRIAVWTNFANRPGQDTQNVIGWFTNSHIIGVSLTPDQSALHLLGQVRGVVLEAHEHQEIPTALLWRILGGCPRNSDANIAFDIFAKDDSAPLSHGVTISGSKLPPIGTKGPIDLHVRVLEGSGGITLFAAYSLDRFRGGPIREMLEALRDLVLAVIANPESPLSRFSIKSVGDNR